MVEVIQRVRTVFAAEAGGLIHDLEAISQAAKGMTRDMSAADREVQRLMNERKSQDFELKINSGSTNSKRVLQDKFNDSELKKMLGFGDEERMADDWMLDELSDMRMKKTMEEWKTSAIGAGDALDELGGDAKVARKGADDLRASVKAGVGPLDGMRSTTNLLKENFGFVAGGAWLLVEGISAISDAFSRSDEIAAAYNKQMEGLGKTLEESAKLRGEVAERHGWTPGLTAREKDLEALIGGRKNAGSWAVQEANRITAETQALQLRNSFKDERGIRFKSTGDVDMAALNAFYRQNQKTDGSTYNDAVAFNAALANQRKAEAEQSALGLSASGLRLDAAFADGNDMKTFEAYEAFVAQYEQVLNKADDRTAVERENLDLVRKQADEMDRLQNTDITIRYMTVGSSAPTTQEKYETERQGRIAAAADEKARLEYARKRFRETGVRDPILSKGVSIDARGSRIQVTTKLQTDDPARFASTALKSAFLGVAARPLSAVFGLGMPALANGRR